MNKVEELLINKCDIYELLTYLEMPDICKKISDNDLLYKNIDKIINNYGKQTSTILMRLSNYSEYYVLSNCLTLIPYYLEGKLDNDYIFAIRNVGIKNIVKTIREFNHTFYNCDFIRCLLVIYKDINCIKCNIDYFIDNTVSLLDLKEIFIEYNLTAGVDKINSILDNDRERLVLDAVYPRTGLTIAKLKEERIYDTIRILIEELANQEDIQLHDIKHLDTGGYSNVLKIGSKVLKLGKKRKNFSVKNNKRFLACIREEIKSLFSNDIIITYEITEMVDTKHNSMVNIYELYKELRDQGLIWTDCHKDNVGILLKDNKVYYKGIDKVDRNATGYTTDNTEILKKGDVVIIDNDYIFTEKEFQSLFNNKRSLQANISSIQAIADFEYQYQIDKYNERELKR